KLYISQTCCEPVIFFLFVHHFVARIYRPFWMWSFQQTELIICLYSAFFDYSEVPAGSPRVFNLQGQINDAVFPGRTPAWSAGLGHLYLGFSQLVNITDADICFIQTDYSKVLTESTGLHVLSKLVRPLFIMIDIIAEHRFFRSAVIAFVPDFIILKARFCQIYSFIRFSPVDCSRPFLIHFFMCAIVSICLRFTHK